MTQISNLIYYKKCSTLKTVFKTLTVGKTACGHEVVGDVCISDPFVFSVQFFYNPKASLNNKAFMLKENSVP